MIITVYQQVYVCGANTKVHVTITGTDGEVIARKFVSYEAYPLATIADTHRAGLLRTLRRSFELETIIYDCNVRGRIEYTPKRSGWKTKQINHPRMYPAETPRIAWEEPTPEEEDISDEQETH
ncbi:hypothetical protein [Paenibacillus sp. Marseille-Q9583]